jgi:pyrimidine-nucleoside phosphorylase
MDGRALGILAMDLGAGRRDRNDVLDLGVGIRVRVTVGQKVHKGDPLFTIYAKAGAQVNTALYQDAVAWSDVAPEAKGWLLGSIGC